MPRPCGVPDWRCEVSPVTAEAMMVQYLLSRPDVSSTLPWRYFQLMESPGGCKTHFLDGWCTVCLSAQVLRTLSEGFPDVPGVGNNPVMRGRLKPQPDGRCCWWWGSVLPNTNPADALRIAAEVQPVGLPQHLVVAMPANKLQDVSDTSFQSHDHLLQPDGFSPLQWRDFQRTGNRPAGPSVSYIA